MGAVSPSTQRLRKHRNFNRIPFHIVRKHTFANRVGWLDDLHGLSPILLYVTQQQSLFTLMRSFAIVFSFILISIDF